MTNKDNLMSKETYSNKELILNAFYSEINANININKDLIKKQPNDEGSIKYVDLVMKPTIALLEMTKDYINTHYKYVESLEYIFSLDKFFSEQLDLLYDTVHNIVLDIDTDIECAFEDTFFDKENFVFNLRDSITNSIQSNI